MESITRPYRIRLLTRAWKETLAAWTIHKWWSVAAAAGFAILVGFHRQGWKFAMTASDIAVNAAGGAILGFAGSWVLSLIRSIKLLDDDRAIEIARVGSELNQRNHTIGELEKKLAAPTKTPAELHHFQIAQEDLSHISEEAKQVVRHIYAHKELHAGSALVVPGLHVDVVLRCLNTELALLRIIRKREAWARGGQDIWWEIPPGYEAALAELLFQSPEE